MAPTSPPLQTFFLILLLSALPPPTITSINASTDPSAAAARNSSAGHALCQSTPYPTACLSVVKLSISVNINPTVLFLALQSLRVAHDEASKLSPLLSPEAGGLTESQRGSLQDCRELNDITLAAIQRSVGLIGTEPSKLADAKGFLSAALTNRATCLEGLSGAKGPRKAPLLDAWNAAYAHVSNSLSLVARSSGGQHKGIRTASSSPFPAWVGRKGRRLLQGWDYGEYDPDSVVVVAADGTGNFSSVGEAVEWAPTNNDDRIIILVRAGVYEENVFITSNKTNIVLIGDGKDVTVIRSNHSVADGWSTFRSATVAVSGDGFLARDITFQNTAGPEKNQAVALRVNADLVALYRCGIDGYQDTLYVHSFRQFYRECVIAGTIDFIFGNAAVVFQGCNLFAKLPLRGQSNAVTAQSKDDPNENTGISIQNCSVLASSELASANFQVRTYLGRPWMVYSTTVYIESYMDGLVDPEGWQEWPGGQGLDTLYYGEYMNEGPGAATDARITWPGYHVMDYDEASSFSVSQFIYGDEWLESTSFPYDNEI
ncbi:probable pectinesterase/pectinesterase inhibitor 12 [Zingiber officinale]|uniref:probable pectinesterase/pectinesterase inhibitor 12 n=1 Tax=Zingiber officinale TaxID=94328 RepID=UPI001C4AEB04|nr:probable pectinesterase/pectinesterase inhibitor 12 [Zingiber officinale]